MENFEKEAKNLEKATKEFTDSVEDLKDKIDHMAGNVVLYATFGSIIGFTVVVVVVNLIKFFLAYI